MSIVGARARSTRFSPSKLASLHTWFRADHITGLNDGDGISSWPDSSGNVHTATQATGGFQPLYKTNIMNGRPVARFDGSDDRMATAAWTAISQPTTIIVVTTIDSPPGGAGGYVYDGIVTGSRHALSPNAVVPTTRLMYAGNSINVFDPLPNVKSIYTTVYNTTAFQAWKNGELISSGSIGSHTLTGLTIGARFNNTEFHKGDIAEILIYNRVLTSIERRQLEVHFSWKYGTTLATPTPMSIATPRLWLDGASLGHTEALGIQQFFDASGQERHAIQTTSGNQPLARLNVLNKKPVPRFDNTNDYMTSTAVITKPVTIAALVRPNNLATSHKTILGTQNNSGLQFRITTGGLFELLKQNVISIGTSTNTALVAGQTALVVATYDASGNYAFRVNKVAAGSGTNNQTLVEEPVQVGNNRTASLTETMSGDIAEVIVYDKILSAGEITTVETYLSTKWGWDTPHTVSGLFGWWEAGQVDNPTDSAVVTTWYDSSSNVRHATQATAGNKPLYKTNILNGRPVLRFDGSNDYLATAAWSAISQPSTVVLVCSFNTEDTVADYAYDGIIAGSRNSFLANRAGVARLQSNQGGTHVGANQTFPISHAVYTVLHNGASSQIWKNGTADTAGGSGTATLTGLVFGSAFDFSSSLNGDIAEVMIFNKALTTGERQTLEAYLGTKYGITVV